MVFTTKRNTKTPESRLIAASMRETRGVFLYEKAEVNIFAIKINKETKTGMNIDIVVPNLCSPHGSWLKTGIKGGSLP